MKRANKGDIVLVRYLRDDGDSYTERPAVVISTPDGVNVNVSVFLRFGAIEYHKGLAYNADVADVGPAKYWRWPGDARI